MNMLNKSIDFDSRHDECYLDNIVTIGGRLSAANEDHKKNIKPYLALVLLSVLALAIYMVFTQYFVPEQPAIVDEAVNPNKLISLNQVLTTKPITDQSVVNDVEMPDAVRRLVGAYELVDKKPAPKSDKVVIYEIIEKVDNSQKISVFLDEARKLYLADRLTSPKGNNAFERYEWVLGMESDNQEALDGINNIVNRYVALAEKVIRKGEEYKVAGLINNAYIVGKKYRDMFPIIQKYKHYIKDQSAFSQIPMHEIAKNQAKAAVASVENKQVIEKSPKKVFDEVDHKIALEAQQLILAGEGDKAKAILKQFAKRADRWGQSYDVLFTLYLQSNAILEAKQFITENTYLDTFQQAEKVAKMFIAGGDTESALSMLKGYQPNINRYPEYYALQASLYRENGLYADAINVYRQLIEIDHVDSRYWLGLAVSLDATGNEAAIEAFHYARKYADGNDLVKQYLQQRLLVSSQ